MAEISILDPARPAAYADGAAGSGPLGFARQPLLSADGRLAGYELRPHGHEIDGSDAVISRLAAHALADLGLEIAAGGAPAFLNVTASLLLAVDPLPFGPEGVVLQIHAPAAAWDEPLLVRLERLRAAGYVLALDGFTGQEAPRLLACLRFVRLDAPTTGGDQLVRLVRAAAQAGLRTIAGNVETYADRDRCEQAGVTLLQGDFLSRPRPMEGREIPATHTGALRLAAAVADPRTDVDDLEHAIAGDPSLNVRLLRFVNSAAFGLRHSVASVRQAIALLGTSTVRQWALLLAMGGGDPRHDGLLPMALARAGTCEAIARHLGADDADAYYFTGMLSTVDILLDVTLERAIQDLPLAPDVTAALLHGAGGKGRVLTMAKACERGNWEAAALPTLSAAELAVLHAAALRRADEAARELR